MKDVSHVPDIQFLTLLLGYVCPYRECLHKWTKLAHEVRKIPPTNEQVFTSLIGQLQQ